MTIQEALTKAKNMGIDLLDAEILIAEVLAVKQPYVLAHPEHFLEEEQQEQLSKFFERRKNHEPLAYITGVKEFYNLLLRINNNVLVPRPESEEAVSWIRERSATHHVYSLLDVGTGSGALALTLAASLPKAHVIGVDTKEKILDVARRNAKDLGINNIEFIKSNLLESIGSETFDAIIANLPYLDPTWQRDPSTKMEPAEALYAEENGLALYKKLLEQLPHHLNEKAFGIFEADPRNAEELKNLTAKSMPDFTVTLQEDLAKLPRFVTFEKV